MQVFASTNTKGLKRVWKRRVRLARKTLTLSCWIPAVLARDCLVFIKGRPVSSLGVFVFEFLGSSFSSFWVLRFRDLGASFSIGASFSRFRCFVFEFWVLRFRHLGASCFGLRFPVLRFRNYSHPPPSRMIFVRLEILKVLWSGGNTFPSLFYGNYST